MKEFAERCHAAARSVQGYMAAENPPPDEDTLLTLIETNDHLSVALSKYQRAVLNARKAVSSGNGNVNSDWNNQFVPSPVEEASHETSPPAPAEGTLFPTGLPLVPAAAPAPSSSPPPQSTIGANRYEYNPDEFQVQNPFADDHVVSPIEESPRRA
jgi:hypothetical protein